ncbi:MAG TPA: peptide ABC transporter substrate-binding protein [Rhizomicrobium sp.]|nr:peptide ABC transporter substrate-binding protein [Rhizomicrobium sp.]
MKKLALAFLLLAAQPAEAETILNRGNGGEPESLDPAFVTSGPETNILGDMMAGLTTLGPAAHPMPGIAQRWEISADGLTWTFHLRQARWSDGKPVTAENFRFAWRRLMDPKTAARGANMLWVIKNARTITAGKLPVTALGVATPDSRTLKITLENPAPYLPELLAHPAALPLPPNPVFAPGRYVSNGPYLLKSWQPNDHITLTKNPAFYDAASVKIDRVTYYPTADAQAALRQLRARQLDMQTPLPSAQVPWLRANMPKSLHIAPPLALAYVPMNLRDPVLADARVRRALNLVYDREAVAQKVMKLGEPPAYSYVPPTLESYRSGPQQDFKALPYPARLTEAKKLMQEAGFGPFNKLTLTYATTGAPDSKRLAAVFQAMARQIHIKLDIVTSDFPLLLRAMRQGQYQLGYAVWLADYGDATTFLDLLRSDNPRNYAGYKNAKFDAAMTAADREPDPARRRRVLQTAENIALADMPWLPIRFLSQTEAVGPRVGGYVPNSRLFHASRWLWVK